jgi:hypothetical protein
LAGALYRRWAQPLLDSIHHDGWQGPNPKHYTTDPRIHGRFESAFVELIQLSDTDLLPIMGKQKVLDDPRRHPGPLE